MDLRERAASSGLRHPWEQARSAAVKRLIGLTGSSPRSVLDVGSGDAWLGAEMSRELDDGVQFACWDAFYSDQELAELQAANPRIAFSSQQPTTTFDLITMLDVLEHVEDDEGFARGIVDQNLTPGGFVVITVPAWPSLFTSHDVALAHHRRYKPQQCRAVLEQAGLEIVHEGGLFSLLLPIRALEALVERLRGERESEDDEKIGIGEWSGGPLLTRALVSVLKRDVQLSLWRSAQGRRLPGLSYWAVAKPQT